MEMNVLNWKHTCAHGHMHADYRYMTVNNVTAEVNNSLSFYLGTKHLEALSSHPQSIYGKRITVVGHKINWLNHFQVLFISLYKYCTIYYNSNQACTKQLSKPFSEDQSSKLA